VPEVAAVGEDHRGVRLADRLDDQPGGAKCDEEGVGVDRGRQMTTSAPYERSRAIFSRLILSGMTKMQR
jgi:hypothetical protein